MTYRKLQKKLRNKLLKIIVVRLIKMYRDIFRLLILPIFKLLSKFKLLVVKVLKKRRGHHMDTHFWFQYRCLLVGVGPVSLRVEL